MLKGGELMLKRKIVSLLVTTLLVSVVLTISIPVFAEKPGRGYLYYEDQVVRTFVPNGKPLKDPGTDPLYAFPNGEQISITRYAPGDKEYRGGHWAVYFVTWNVAPYEITSYEDLMAAGTDVTITRNAAADVLCPVLPGSMWNPNA